MQEFYFTGISNSDPQSSSVFPFVSGDSEWENLKSFPHLLLCLNSVLHMQFELSLSGCSSLKGDYFPNL